MGEGKAKGNMSDKRKQFTLTVEERSRFAFCPRCGKKPKTRFNVRYQPYCSYSCQEWHRLEQAMEFVRHAAK